LPQIDGWHLHLGGHAQGRVTAQHGPHRLLADRPPLVQKLRQRRLDARLALPRRQVQHPHVLPVCTLGLLRLQGVVSTPKYQRRVKVGAIHVTRERSRLPHQPIDHVPIVDAMLVLPA
jgi:hypothetical protein